MRKDLKKFYNRKEFPKDENRSALNSYSKKRFKRLSISIRKFKRVV